MQFQESIVKAFYVWDPDGIRFVFLFLGDP